MAGKPGTIEWSLVIITDGGRAARRERWAALVGLGAALAALAAALVYASHGLTLSHYDGRAHLVVARKS